jgi:hypothetical protein
MVGGPFVMDRPSSMAAEQQRSRPAKANVGSGGG